MLWHRGIEGNEIANELTVTGSGAPLTGPELAKGRSDRTPQRPQGQGDLEDSTGPHLYRTMQRVCGELSDENYSAIKQNLRQMTPYVTGQLFKIGYHPKKADVTMSTENVRLELRNRT